MSNAIKVNPEWAPKSKQEAYERLHYYVSRVGVSVSHQLQGALGDIRANAHNLMDPELQKLAIKAFSEDEFAYATKELMCIWLHIEAIHQGGQDMPDWLLTFLRLAFGVSDYVIPQPKAESLLAEYEDTSDLKSLGLQCSIRVANVLGFGSSSTVFAPAISPIILQTGGLRRQILQDALTLPEEEISAEGQHSAD